MSRWARARFAPAAEVDAHTEETTLTTAEEIHVRIPPNLKRALKTAATDEGRSVCGMTIHILKDWLEGKGFAVGASPRPYAKRAASKPKKKK